MQVQVPLEYSRRRLIEASFLLSLSSEVSIEKATKEVSGFGGIWQLPQPMKQLASLFLALLTLTATAQINYPYNPDENADAFISTPDLMEFLVVFGYEWEQEEIQVDSIPLSMYLSSLEAMIQASALPEGTMPGQFLQWMESPGIW